MNVPKNFFLHHHLIINDYHECVDVMSEQCERSITYFTIIDLSIRAKIDSAKSCPSFQVRFTIYYHIRSQSAWIKSHLIINYNKLNNRKDSSILDERERLNIPTPTNSYLTKRSHSRIECESSPRSAFNFQSRFPHLSMYINQNGSNYVSDNHRTRMFKCVIQLHQQQEFVAENSINRISKSLHLLWYTEVMKRCILLCNKANLNYTCAFNII